jgi:lipopolysaccharide transport system permease protein
MISDLRMLVDTHDLLWAWTYRTIRGRYQQSVLGGLWAIIQPAAAVAIFSIIFTYFVPVDTGDVPYVLFSYVAMVPWTLFSSSITDMVNSLVANMNLVTKIYFPREVLPIAALLSRLVDFAIASVLIVVLLVYFRWPVNIWALLFLPIILLVEIVLALGVGLMGAALNVFYRDIAHIVVLGLQIWFYATPIIYPVSVVPEELHTIYFLNPMAGVVEGFRDVILYGELPGPYLAISASVSVVVFIVGFWFFKRVEFQFADVV